MKTSNSIIGYLLGILTSMPCLWLHAQGEVKIGTQVWSGRNLNTDKFRNGDPIPEARTPDEWMKAGDEGKPAWCYYNNDPANGAKYGKLYNWFAVNDARGLAPAGWHIPSEEEWQTMFEFIGGETRGGSKLKNKTGWDGGVSVTNESGFSALPGGTRNYSGAFNGIGYAGYWWTSTAYDDFKSGSRYLTADVNNVYRGNGQKDGYSVRCIKD